MIAEATLGRQNARFNLQVSYSNSGLSGPLTQRAIEAPGSCFSSAFRQELGVEGALGFVLCCEYISKLYKVMYITQGPPLLNKIQ